MVAQHDSNIYNSAYDTQHSQGAANLDEHVARFIVQLEGLLVPRRRLIAGPFELEARLLEGAQAGERRRRPLVGDGLWADPIFDAKALGVAWLLTSA